MFKKFLLIIICVCTALAIGITEVIFADGINSGQIIKPVSDIISVEDYLIALYKSVYSDELTDEIDITEVMVWAENNGILEGILDSTQNISEIPLTQETALTMLSRSYSELTEIADMITSVSHPANNRQPSGMPQQPKEHNFNMENTENTQYPDLSNSGEFSEDIRHQQMPKAENTDSTQNILKSTGETNKNSDERPAFDMQGGKNRPQGENMQMPSGNRFNQNNSQGNADMDKKVKQNDSSTNTKRNTAPSENTQTKYAEKSGGQIGTPDMIEETEITPQITDVSFKEHIKEYYTTYISLLILAGAFIFIKLFRRK